MSDLLASNRDDQHADQDNRHVNNGSGGRLLLDGDPETIIDDQTSTRKPFCAVDVARSLAEWAREAGGGAILSVACVFARQEYESWLLAGFESLRGKALPDGRPGVSADAPLPAEDTDTHPRDAKRWLSQNMARGYKETTDQRVLTEMVSLESIRRRDPRSFRRLEHAIAELCEAIRTDNHIVSPVSPPKLSDG